MYILISQQNFKLHGTTERKKLKSDSNNDNFIILYNFMIISL